MTVVAKAADEATYLRTAFLGRIAHELRGPSGVIHGALQELEAALGEDAEKFRPLLNMAERGVRRVLRTAARLEETGLLEDGAIRFMTAPSDLVPLVRAATQDAETLEARRKITVTVTVPETPVMARVDGRWMALALSEIASNAIRHARSKVDVKVQLEDGGISITCTDDNPGAEAFEPLRFREPRERRGLGLSLAIVRDIVHGHEGTLDIEVGMAGGTRVAVRLPRAGEEGTGTSKR